MKKKKSQSKSPPAWANYPLTGTYMPEVADQIRQALHIWKQFETLRVQNKRSTHESMTVGLLTHDNFYVRVVARLEALPMRVFREFLWRYNVDFASFEACLRRFTLEQYNALDDVWGQLEFQRVPDMYRTTLWSNVRRWTGNITWQKLQDYPEDFVHTTERYRQRHAIVSNLFPGAPLDVGYRLYVNEYTDEIELKNGDGQVLAVTTESSGWSGFLGGLLDDKNFANEHGLNGTLGIDVNRDGPFGIMYRAMMGEFIFDWKMGIPGKFCWAFLTTLLMHVYFWLVAPVCAVIGYIEHSGVATVFGMPFAIWLGSVLLFRTSSWLFGRVRSSWLNRIYQRCRPGLVAGVAVIINAVGELFAALWLGFKVLLPAMVVAVFSFVLYRAEITLWLIVPHVLYIANIMYRGMTDDSKLPKMQSWVFVVLTSLIALQVLWIYALPAIGEFIYDWLVAAPSVVVLVYSIIALWVIGLVVGRNAGRHGERRIARNAVLWMVLLVPHIMVGIVTAWSLNPYRIHLPAGAYLVISLAFCFGLALGLMTLFKLIMLSQRSTKVEDNLWDLESFARSTLNLKSAPYLSPRVGENRWFMGLKYENQAEIVDTLVDYVEDMLVWFDRNGLTVGIVRNSLVVPVLNALLPTLTAKSYHKFKQLHAEFETMLAKHTGNRARLIDVWNRVPNVRFLADHFVLQATNHTTMESLIGHLVSQVEVYETVQRERLEIKASYRVAIDRAWEHIEWVLGWVFRPVWILLKGIVAVFRALNRACPMYEKPGVNRFD